MRIIVKSSPEFWEKELRGDKSSTIRELDGRDVIEIVNAETGEKFERIITDLTVWKGKMIISFKKDDEK